MAGIDPSIPLKAIQPIPQTSPLDLYQQIQQIQGLRAESARRQLEAAAKQRAEESAARLRAATTFDPVTGQVKVDYPSLTAHVDPDKIANVQEAIARAAKVKQDLETSTLGADEKKRAYLGSLADIVKESGYDPQTLNDVTVIAHAAGALTDKEAESAHAFSPDAAFRKHLVDSAIAMKGAPKPPDLAEVHTVQNGVEGTMFAPKVAGAFYPSAPKAAGAGPAIGSFEDYVQRDATARQKPIESYSTADIDALREKFRLDQRPSVTVINPAARSVAGDFTKTGDEFLQTIPIAWRATVKKIGNYEEDPTKVASMRGGMRETLTQWVNQYNPEWRADVVATRAPTRKAFTTGIQGRQINSINTAIGHLDQLSALAPALQTGGFVPGNRAWNALRTMLGSDAVTNFDTLKSALSGEVASVLSQSGATVSEIADARSHIGAANSPTQLAGYVKTVIPIMTAKLINLDYQYHQAMGADDPFSALSPESKRILQKHGIDPAHSTLAPGSSAAPGGGPGLSYQDYLNSRKK